MNCLLVGDIITCGADAAAILLGRFSLHYEILLVSLRFLLVAHMSLSGFYRRVLLYKLHILLRSVARELYDGTEPPS